MRIKKRKKNTRYRGSQTHRRGHRKRTKGLGNRGGVGMGGSENQKKSLIMNLYGPSYFGGDRARRRGRAVPKLKVINLNDLIEKFDNLINQGIAKQTSKGFEFNLKGYKVLSGSSGASLNAKISVKASAASEAAIAQIKEAGGTIELDEVKEIEVKEKVNKEVKAEEKKEEKEESLEKKIKKEVKKK